MIKAVIIDFDDTLVQTSRFRKGLLEETIRAYYKSSSAKAPTLNWDQPFRQMVEGLIGADQTTRFLRQYTNAMAQNPILPCLGATDFLRYLQQRHIPVVILSSSLQELIEFDLCALGFNKMIAQIFDPDRIGCFKPNPLALQVTLRWLQQHYRVCPRECIFVGDSLSDLKCARNQIDFFAVLSGTTVRQFFLANNLPKKKVFDNLYDLTSSLF